MAQQTAVEWLQIKMATSSIQEMVENINVWFKEAKQMQKEQIINACIHTASKLSDVGLSDITINGEIELAEQYYNETYAKQ